MKDPEIQGIEARRGEDRDVIFGHEIPDPYRWLEVADSEETRTWVKAQTADTSSWFAGTGRLEELVRQARETPLPLTCSAIAAAAKRLFFVQPHPRGGYPTLSMMEEGRLRVIVDPEALGPEITIARHGVYPSPSGRLVAYGVQKVGDDVATMRIRDVERGIDIDEIEPTVLPIIAWRDEAAFYYNALRGIYRQAGQRPEETGLILKTIGGSERRILDCPWDGGWTVQPFISPDRRYLFVNRVQLLRNRSQLLSRRLQDDNAPFDEVLPEADGSTAVVGLDGDDIFVSTTTGEDRGRILKKGPGHEPCEIVAAGSDIIASSPYPTARMSTIWRDQLFVTRLRDGHSTLTIHALDGSEIGEIATPGFCSINGLLPTIDGLLVQLESFTIPETLWSIDTSRLMLSRAVPAATPSLAMEWKTEIAISSDGTRVPCTVATPEGQATPHPVLLLAYGGLGAPMTPRFREEIWLALHQGISVALAHVRGGGEFGRAWHRAAMGANKQRTFDDFYAVAGKLIESRITTANRLMVKGESYGGLLAAVAYTQRPELFAAVVAEVPLLDVVRQLALPGGGVVGADLGDPLKNETIFNHVLAFAPMQNLSPHDRKPALLVTPAALDNRALPGQAFKFVAAAQRVARSDQPVLLNLVENCGHSGWALSARREQAARTVAFLASVPHP